MLSVKLTSINPLMWEVPIPLLEKVKSTGLIFFYNMKIKHEYIYPNKIFYLNTDQFRIVRQIKDRKELTDKGLINAPWENITWFEVEAIPHCP
jgi:hypothetical protein